jgi:hypothetical protein
MIEIIQQYRSLKEHFSDILEWSGYRLDFLAKEIGMPKASIYVKKQRKSFTEDEMEKLLDIVWTDKIEDKFFAQALLEGDKDENMNANEIAQMLKECN